MKSLNKLPLYLGLSIFVFSVLVSAVKVGERNSLTSQQTRASASKATLELKFSTPDIVSVVLTSGKKIAGVDAVIKFDKNKLKILPSTLHGGSSFITAGGVIEEQKGLFSFSALAKEEVSSGIVANFNIAASTKSSVDSELHLLVGQDGSSVLEKTSLENILDNAGSVKVNLPAK
jgi:hypothetical protein